MSWYHRREDASAFGHQAVSHTGDGPTYYDIKHAEAVKESADYRRVHLHKWLMEQWGKNDVGV